MKPHYCLLFLLLGFSTAITQAQINCSFTLDADKGCSPMLITATANETSAYPIYQRQWNIRNSSGSVNQPSPLGGVNTIFQYIANTATCEYYIVTLWSKNTNGDTCRTSDTVYVYPKVEIQPVVVIADCPADSPTIVLYPNAFTCAGVLDSIAVAWGDGSVDYHNTSFPGDSFIHTYNATQGCFDISIIAHSTIGCWGDTTMTNAVCIGVTTEAKGYVSTDTVTCISPPTTIQFFDTSATSSASRLWKFGDGATSVYQNPTHIYITPGVYVVELIRYYLNCADTLRVDTIVVFGPQLASYNVSPTTFCACEDTVEFILNTVDAVSVQLLYGCNVPGSQMLSINPVGTEQSPSTATFSKSYCTVGTCLPVVTLQSANGCTKFYNLTTVYPDTPAIDFQFDRTNACIDGNFCFLSLVDYAQNKDSTISQLWDFGDGTTDTIAHPCHYFTQEGTFNVTLTVTSKNGCSRTITKQVSNDFSLNPEADFTFSYITPTNIDFQNQSTHANSSEWHFGDGTVSFVWSPSKVFTSGGNFEVVLVVADSLGCSDTVSKYVSIVTGVNNMQRNGLYVSPNPFSEYTTVSVQDVADNFEIKLFNLIGQQIHTVTGKPGIPVTIHRGNLTSGVYLLEVSTNGNKLGTSKLSVVD